MDKGVQVVVLPHGTRFCRGIEVYRFHYLSDSSNQDLK